MSAISNLDGSGLIGIEKLQKAFISIMPNFSNMIGNHLIKALLVQN